MKLFSVQGIKFSGTGSNCIVDGSTVGIVSIRSQMTIRLRFKVISNSFPYDILVKNNEYKLGINSSGNIVFSVYDGSDWDPCITGPVVSTGQWYDVICLIVAGTDVINKVMYVNSVDDKFEETTQSGSISQTTNNLVIGECEVIVDNFMLWSRTLNDSDIELVFNGGIPFLMLDFWLAFEDVESDSTETTEVVYKRYKGALNNFEIVDGKELEEVKASNSKIVVVKKY